MDTHFFTVADWWKFYIHKFHRVRAVKLNRKNNTFYTTKLTEWETIISFVNTTVVVVVVFLLLSWCLFALKWPYSLAISTRLAWACVAIVSFPSLRETPESLWTKKKKKKDATRRRTPPLSILVFFPSFTRCRKENKSYVGYKILQKSSVSYVFFNMYIMWKILTGRKEFSFILVLMTSQKLFPLSRRPHQPSPHKNLELII